MIGLTEPSQTEGVQPLSTVTEILSSESVLQEKGAGEEKSIWSTCQKSGAWRLFNIRRNGTNSQCGLQTNILNDCP